MTRSTIAIVAVVGAIAAYLMTRPAGNGAFGTATSSQAAARDLADLESIDLGGFSAGRRAARVMDQQSSGVERGFTGL